MSIPDPGSDTGRLTVRYLADSGHVQLRCTSSGDTVLVSAADIGEMLAAVDEFVSARPCCVIS